MKRKNRTVHKENCEQKVRATIESGSDKITLMGQHGFSWSIVREHNGRIYITEYPSSTEARKDFHNIKMGCFNK